MCDCKNDSPFSASGSVNYRRVKALGGAMHHVLHFCHDSKAMTSRNSRVRDFLASQVTFLSEERLDELSEWWQKRLQSGADEEVHGRVCRLLLEEEVTAFPAIPEADFLVLVHPTSQSMAEMKIAIETLTGTECLAISLCNQGMRIPIEVCVCLFVLFV
jgi:hypothetical protein